MILDCVPVRVSIAYRKRWKVELPWTKLVFVAPGHTPTCQPLHSAYSKAITAAVGNKCCKYLGQSVLDAIAEGGSPAIDLRLSSLKQPLLLWISSVLVAVSSQPNLCNSGAGHDGALWGTRTAPSPWPLHRSTKKMGIPPGRIRLILCQRTTLQVVPRRK